MAKQAEPLAMDKVIRSLQKLPSRLRCKFRSYIKRKLEPRHGSEEHKRFLAKNGKAELAVTKAEKADMARAIAYGVSYRANEVIFDLKPESGMDAYRCVQAIREDKEVRKEVKIISRATGIKVKNY